jgi:hypothetical protein
MKRFFSYNIFPVALLLSVAVIYITPQERIAAVTSPAATSSHTLSAPSEKDHFLMPPNMPTSPLAINSIINAGIPATYARTGENTHHSLKSCYSLLSARRFFMTQSTYISHYARKVKNGYYLFTLRQLRI